MTAKKKIDKEIIYFIRKIHKLVYKLIESRCK